MKKTVQTIARLGVASVMLAAVVSCNNDDDTPTPVNEEENINKVVVTYTEDGGTAQTATWQEGVDNTEAIDLDAGKTYDVSLKFYDGDEEINPEIIEEKDDHFVSYAFVGTAVTVERTNDEEVRTDGNNVGVTTKWTTAATLPTSVNIKLIHQPDTVNDDANSGAGSYTGGEEDVNVSFTIE